MDPIAGVRLWPLVPLVMVTGVVVQLLLAPARSSELETTAAVISVFGITAAWWLSAVNGATRRAGFHTVAMSRASWMMALKVALGNILLTLVWVLTKHWLGLERVGLVTDSFSFAPSEPTASAFASVVFQLALLAPAAEEMLFRGALFRKWRLRLGPAKAALLTSVLFGLGHANPQTTAVFGLSMAVLYTSTRTIWAPVLAHVVNNLFAFTLSNGLPLLPLALLQAGSEWPLQVVLLVPGLLGSWWLVRFLRRGWHTLGAPVHGEPASVTVLSPAQC